MGYVISFFWITGIVFLAINQNLGQLTNIITTATANCASFVLKLLFLTAFFSGMIKIAEEIGLNRLLAKILSPILTKIFTTKDQRAIQKMSVNISANMLGIGNAATPSGLAAMEELNQEVGLKRLEIIAADGPANYIRPYLNALDEEEFQYFIQYHLATCERADLLGASGHLVDILQK